MPAREAVGDAGVALHERGERDRGVIHQALADAEQGAAHGDAEVAQVAGGADAGAHQVGGRVDGAGREDHLVRAEFPFLAVDPRLDADALQAIEQQFGDLRLAGDRQVLAPAHVTAEITDRRGDALFLGVRNRAGEVAVLEVAVLVGKIRIAGAVEGFLERGRMDGPLFLGDAADEDRPFLAVPFVLDVEVGLELPEIREHALPVPSLGATRGPFVVVGRRAAVGHLAVDRGAAAEDAGLLVLSQWRFLGVGIVVRDDLGAHLQVRP